MSDKIRITTFGNFTIQYGSSLVTLEKNSKGNATNIFLFLLHNLGKEVPKQDLIDAVFFDNSVDNPSNNLKVNLLRLRKLIASSSLPQGDYIVTKSKTYTLTSPVFIESDTQLFENYIIRAHSQYVTPQQKLNLLLSAEGAYTGPFLPELSHIPWIQKAQENYRNLYLACLKEIYPVLKEENKLPLLRSLCAKAGRIHPLDEEINALHLSCLMDMKLTEEAKKEYQALSKRVFNSTGKSLSENTHSIIQHTENTSYTVLTAKDLSRNLGEKKVSAMDFSDFKNIIHLAKALSRKNGLPSFLTLLTITDTHGIPLETGEKLTSASTLANKAIENNVSSHMLFSRYSHNQFVVLSAGAKQTQCLEDIEKIISAFNEYKLRGIRIETSSTEI